LLEHFYAQSQAPKRVVVMGARGFVGGAICRHLTEQNINVFPITRDEVDLMQPDAAKKLADRLLPDDAFVAVSAAAPVKNPAMLRDNITMIESIVDALKFRPVSHVLNIGSDAVFSDSLDRLTETSCRAPTSLHGLMHLTREVMLKEASGIDKFATLRPTLIYGAGDPHNGYGPNRFRRQAAKGETIKLFGEGEERRDHVWVEDVAELAVRILMQKSCGSLNAATGCVMSFRDIAEFIASLVDTPPEIEGSPRHGAMPHNGYRPFDNSATTQAFPDFRYTLPRDGFALVQKSMGEEG